MAAAMRRVGLRVHSAWRRRPGPKATECCGPFRVAAGPNGPAGELLLGNPLLALQVGEVLPYELAHRRRDGRAIDVVASSLRVLADHLAVWPWRAAHRE